MALFRSRPNLGTSDNPGATAPASPRYTWYGDAAMYPYGNGRHSIADEGSYFTCVNPTLGTAIAGATAPAIADTYTKPLLHLFNGGTATIFPDYLKLYINTVNASSTATDFLVYIDNGGATGRTGGGTQITPANTNSANPRASGATVYFGAVTATTPTTAVKVAQWTVRPVIAVTLDQYYFKFGDSAALNAGVAYTGTSLAPILCSMPPVAIAPGGNLYFMNTNPSGAITAATWEFEFGYWER